MLMAGKCCYLCITLSTPLFTDISWLTMHRNHLNVKQIPFQFGITDLLKIADSVQVAHRRLPNWLSSQ